jgi:hypothetical protein
MLPQEAGGAAWLRAWLLPGALCAVCLAAALTLTLRPPASGPVALLFPPWWSTMRSVVAAASMGSVVRLGAVPFIVVVQPDRNGLRVSAARNVAWLVLDPQALGGCGLFPRDSE